MTGSVAEQVFRPASDVRRRFSRRALLAVGVFLVPGVVGALITLDPRWLTVSVPFEVLAVPLAGAVWSYVCRAHVVVGPETIATRSWLRSRVTRRGDLADPVRVNLREWAGGVGDPGPIYREAVPRLALLRVDGRRLAVLTEQFWGPEVLDALPRALGLPVEDLGTMTLRALRGRKKGAIRWAAAHQATAVLLSILGLFVLCFVVLALVSLGTAVF